MMAYLRALASVIQHRSVKLGVGIVNALLTLSIIFTLKSMLGAADTAANLAGYGAGLIASFALNRKWAFPHETRLMSSLSPFLPVFGASLC
jgi:putative flippase GtrA